MRRYTAYVMVMVFVFNAIICNAGSAQAFELREGDVFEDDEDYDDMEFEEPDENEEYVIDDITDDDYEEALDILTENKVDTCFRVLASWQDHSNVEVTLTNSMEEDIEDWEIRFDMDAEIENIWNAQITKKEGNTYTIKNVYWNQDIACGGTASFGMTISYRDGVEFPDTAYLTKEAAEVLDEYDVTYKEYSRWDGTKVNGEITIHNLSDRIIDDWKLELETGIKMEQVWNAVVEESDDHYIYLNNSCHNASIAPGGTVSFGFIGEAEGDAGIDEYYLYDMMELVDEETEIEGEVEDGYERDEDEFDTEEEYRAYIMVRSALLKGKKVIEPTGDDKKGYARPALRPGKVTMGDKGIEFEIKGIKLEKDLDTNNPKTSSPTAVQSYAKLGDKYYIAQRKGNDIFISTCSVDSQDNKVLNFDDGSTMRLKGFAHGQTFEFVSCNGEMYMLLGANVRKEFSQSLALVKYNARSVLNTGENNNGPDFGMKRITKLAYANQKRKYFARVGRIDAALSEDNRTLCVWFANDINGDDDDEKIKTTKIQIACYSMPKIIKYFEDNPDAKSLSFKSMKKKWCNYSCEQKEKTQLIRPGGSNQGIEVSDTYGVKDKKGDTIKKNKVYFTSGDEHKKKPLYISMMTIGRNSTKDLTKNGSYRTQLRVNPEKVDFGGKKIAREIESLHIEGKNIIFIIAPNNGKGTDKSRQYLCSIPTKYMQESQYKKRSK